MSLINTMDLINIESLNEFVGFDGLNAYDGRVKYVLKLYMSKREYLMFKFLCNERFVDTFLKRYKDRIKVRMISISSNINHHYIEIDGRKFYLVGNDIQFKAELKDLIRQGKIDDILDEE